MIDLTVIRAALSNGGISWTAGENPITQLPWEEQLIRLGVPLDHGEIDAAAPFETDQSVMAPPAFDHRSLGGQNYVTGVKDQASCGSCVAFGALATIETTYARMANHPNSKVDLSEAHLFFCYAESEGRNCETGWWPSKAYNHIVATGVADEACYRYRLPSDHCQGRCTDWARRVAKVASATRLANATQMKDWISANGPLSACFYVYDDFFHYSSGVYRHVTGGLAGGHCISIIGYSDADGCWICKNSWGSRWGEAGFFRIAYGECNIETWETHGVRGVTVPGNP